jgi:hypothetical protein
MVLAEAIEDSPNDALLPILSAVCELPQAVLINVVDLLAYGTGRVSGVVGSDHHVAMRLAAHDCNCSLAVRNEQLNDRIQEREDAVDWCMRTCSYAVSCELVVYLAWSCWSCLPRMAPSGSSDPPRLHRHLMTAISVSQAWNSRHLMAS